MPNSSVVLLPQPRSMTIHGGELALGNGKLIVISERAYFYSAQRIQQALAKIGVYWDIAMDSSSLPADSIELSLEYGTLAGKLVDQIYQLEIGNDGITIRSAGQPGIWYGVCTLIQIISQAGRRLPLLSINDSPDFERRGVMLDISRDKVPTMDTLYALIDRLASWKINEVQLYMEHTFAYRGHETVWAKASPLTGQEIMELDQFCQQRYIDLVPNQNSFGHMHRWLRHDRYRPLAEVPEGLDWTMFLRPQPFSLAAADPGSITLIKGLYDELLPHFSSHYFNVGCDETVDLGKGRSRALVEARGKGRVYLDFVHQISTLVREHGRIMQFWGEIIVQHPELVPELPRDAIALEWGYESDHPFDADGACFAQAGVKFYVCPGTSSWMSLLGRADNAIANLRSAAQSGKKHGALGYLITDWGDYGHWQPLPVSYLGFAYGAALSWAIDANFNLDLPAALSRFAFEDDAGIMGQLACDLGNVYRVIDTLLTHNGTSPARALLFTLEQVRTEPWRPKDAPLLDPAVVRKAMIEIDKLEATLADARLSDPLVVPEYRLAIRMWRHGCKRLLMAQDAQAFSLKEMADDMRAIMQDYRERWLARNRPGGLDDSLVRMQRLLGEYESGGVA